MALGSFPDFSNVPEKDERNSAGARVFLNHFFAIAR